MRLKIPPAFQILFFAFLMWSIKKLSNQTHFNFQYQKEVSWFLFLSGVFLGSIAVYYFRKAKTTIDPVHPEKASKLVIHGIFRFTRNPMYVAMLFVLLAYLVKLGNLYNILVILLYILYITEFQIKAEEETLEKLFGVAYLNYKSKVRRWI